MRGRLLLVDDSSDYRRSLGAYLRLEEYQVDEAATLAEALQHIETGHYDLILVDLRLTDDNDTNDFGGLEVAQVANRRGLPCILVTSHESVEVTRQALRSRGGVPLTQDMVPKANGPLAVTDAIAAVLSRRQVAEPEGRAPAGLAMDLERKRVWLDGQELDLPPLQYALLAFLCEARGAVCYHAKIVQAVYGENLVGSGSDKRLERLVARTRKRIESDPAHPALLLSVPGRGLRLIAECRTETD